MFNKRLKHNMVAIFSKNSLFYDFAKQLELIANTPNISEAKIKISSSGIRYRKVQNQPRHIAHR